MEREKEWSKVKSMFFSLRHAGYVFERGSLWAAAGSGWDERGFSFEECSQEEGSNII